jgi:hypothetical protein
MQQLEITVVPWDGQLTFTHYIANKAFGDAARKTAEALKNLAQAMQDNSDSLRQFGEVATQIPLDEQPNPV